MYATLLRSVLFPLYETHLRGRETLEALAELESSQWRSKDALAEDSFRRLLEALRHAERYVPFYRKRFAEYGVRVSRVKDPSDLERFPVLTKDDVRAHADELVSEVHRGNLHHSSTGGSTGEPLRFVYDHRAYERRVAAAIRANRWAGAELGEKELHVWGRTPGEPRLFMGKRAMYDALLRRRFVSSFHLDEGRLDATLHGIAAYGPRAIIGYTTPLFWLARAALERGIAIPPPRGIITSAERLFDHQRDAIERAFGAPVHDRYGCREMMLIGAECAAHEGLHLNVEGVFVELYAGGRPALPGEAGEVLLSDLENRAMPLLRYRNGDVAIGKTEGCSCGRGLPLLASVEGRVLDMIVVEGGRVVAGEVFPHLLKDFPVDRFQVHQRKDYAIVLRIVPGRGFENDTAAKIEALFRQTLGKGVDLRLELVRDIPLTPAGKHRIAISDVSVDLLHDGATPGAAKPSRIEVARANAGGATRSRPKARVAHVVLSLGIGGLERVVEQLVERVDRSRFEPMVIALESAGTRGVSLAQKGVELCVLGPHAPLAPRAIVTLSRLIEREGIDLVHTHNPGPHVHGALAVALARGASERRPRLVHTKHGRNHPDDTRLVLACRMATALSDRIVAVSDDARRVAIEVERPSPHRLVMIPNGVDTDAVRPRDRRPSRRALSVPEGVFHVGCVARLSAEKDHATLLEAFQKVRERRPDARLSLVGEGPMRPSLEVLAGKLGLEGAVTFLGHRDDVAEILPSFDVFALASRTEGMSLTLLEAAAAGVPVVATRVGGNPEVVREGETGLLVPAGEPARLADALLALAGKDEADRVAMGARGRDLVAMRHGAHRMIAAYEALYAETLRLG